MKKFLKEREEINNLYENPRNRRLKHIAIAVIGIVFLLLIAMIVFADSVGPGVRLIMRGCAGVGALIFVGIVGLLSYRVNKLHITNRKK